MASQLELYNQALGQALSRSTLASTSENRPEAKQCNTHYDTVRKNVIRAASWPSAKKHATLALLKERDFSSAWADTDPAPGYRYAYAVPSDMLAPRYLHSYERFELEYYEPTGVMAIMTNDTSPVLHYVFDQTNVAIWDNGLYRAVMFALSAHIALPLSGKPGLAQYLTQQALDIIVQAQTDIANEADDYQESVGEMVEVRGYSGPAIRSQYIYPYETLNGVTA